jgi:hypothetical protein
MTPAAVAGIVGHGIATAVAAVTAGAVTTTAIGLIDATHGAGGVTAADAMVTTD